MKPFHIRALFAVAALVVAVGTLGCATLDSLRGSVLGSGRTIAATNAMAVPICQVDVKFGDKIGQASVRENESSFAALQHGIRPGEQAYLVLPFDPADSPTFDLGAHACTSDTGNLASESVVASIKGLRSSDIERYHAEPVVLH